MESCFTDKASSTSACNTFYVLDSELLLGCSLFLCLPDGGMRGHSSNQTSFFEAMSRGADCAEVGSSTKQLWERQSYWWFFQSVLCALPFIGCVASVVQLSCHRLNEGFGELVYLDSYLTNSFFPVKPLALEPCTIKQKSRTGETKPICWRLTQAEASHYLFLVCLSIKIRRRAESLPQSISLALVGALLLMLVLSAYQHLRITFQPHVLQEPANFSTNSAKE